MKSFTLLLVSFLLFLTIPGIGFAGNMEIVPGVPAKNTVTMVDLGAKTCIPCKMMAPILEELKAEYKGRAEVIFIDVWDKANKGKAQAFKIMGIPTQIFYNSNGDEVYRHIGFLAKESIREKLDALLAE